MKIEALEEEEQITAPKPQSRGIHRAADGNTVPEDDMETLSGADPSLNPAHADPGVATDVSEFMDAIAERDPVEADRIKTLGNKAYAANEFESALALYSDALKHDVTAVLFANRSACYLKLRNWRDAKEDAARALSLDPTYAKGFFRRADALANLEEYAAALKDLDECERLGLKTHETAERRLQWRQKQEQKQQEMLDQLKSLGNQLLGKFGLSTDMFKMEKNPDGGYSLKMGAGGNSSSDTGKK